jgi:hypothetical protein
MDANQIRFKAGEPFVFMTTRPFALGNTGVTVSRGTEILFDGTKASVEGAEYVLPQLRGALKAGWLVLAEDYDENAVVERVRANIQVRHPTNGGNPLNRQSMPTSISEEERDVGNIRAHADATRTANTGYVRGQTRVNAGQPVMTQKGMMVVESQEGIVVDRPALKTANLATSIGGRTRMTGTNVDMTSQVESDLAKIKIQPGQGVSREELIDRMGDEERESYLAEIESRKAAYVNEAPRQAKKVDDQRKVVGRVASSSKKTQSSEGITAKVSTGSGIETVDLSGGGQSTDVREHEQEGLKFTTTNGPKRDLVASEHPRQTPGNPVVAKASAPRGNPPSVNIDIEVRRKIAKAICPDFPDNYRFDLPARKKLARLRADYEDQAEVLRAAYHAEDDEMKTLLAEEFPQALAG